MDILLLTGSYSYSFAGAYTVGWAFNTLEDIQVTDLGVFDLDNDGLYHSTRVGIWDADTGHLLLDADVYSTSLYGTTWHQGFQYVGVAPFPLTKGAYVIGNVSYEVNPDYYVYNAVISESSQIDWTGSRHLSGTHLSLPTLFNSDDENAACWLGPNLMFTTTAP